MMASRVWWLAAVLHLLLLLLLVPPVTPTAKKNVLLIVCDDLRPELAAYNHSHMLTPNMDKLAESSLLFERAYTNYAYCCPSRNSFMSGRMPGTSKVFNFINSFRVRLPVLYLYRRESDPDPSTDSGGLRGLQDSTVRDRTGLPGTSWTTLPEHFKKNGFWTVGSGA